jgi:sugar lactone lactonase YvrE
MTEPQVLLNGIAFGESPRWHEGRLWFSDWSAEELLTVDLKGHRELIVRVPSFPFCFDWLPNGRLLIVSARAQALLTLEPDGTLAAYADLSGVSDRPPGNEIVVDGRGNAYVNGGGFDLMAGEAFAPGVIALATPDGTVREVAEGIAFPNGMAITADAATLIVAESYAGRLTAFEIAENGDLENRRVWAQREGAAPDGICIDAAGAVWYADVPNRRCVRIREGGEVLEEVEFDRGCLACMLGGDDGKTLFIVAREWSGTGNIAEREPTGQILTLQAPEPHAGRP